MRNRHVPSARCRRLVQISAPDRCSASMLMVVIGVSGTQGYLPCSATLVASVYEMSRLAFRRRAESHPGHRPVAGGLARAAVFGVSDGLVSNVSLVIGFAGAGVDSSVVRLAGLAGAIAGATSMAAGEWVSISAQNELVMRELAVERRELVHNTESETAELAAMYEGHGMTRAIA